MLLRVLAYVNRYVSRALDMIQEVQELKGIKRGLPVESARAKQLLDNEKTMQIIDVREPDEFAAGHIEGARTSGRIRWSSNPQKLIRFYYYGGFYG